MNFSQVTAITLPRGKGFSLSLGGRVVWQAEKSLENLMDTVGVTANKRLSVSSGSVKDNTGTFVTGFVPLGEKGDVLRTKGADFNADKNGNLCVVIYHNDQTYWTYTYTKPSASPIVIAPFTLEVDEQGNLTITVTGDTPRYIRLCGSGSGEGLILTRNQPIA